MNFGIESILIIIGSVFLLLGLAGSIKIKGTEAKLLRGYQKIASLTIGIIFIIYGSFSNTIVNSDIETNNDTVEQSVWQGEWNTIWNYNEHFFNIKDTEKEHILKFEIVGGKLKGYYISTPIGKPARTELYDLAISNNRLTGKYKGLFTKDNSDYENGIFEFLMFGDNKHFVGRYMRKEPNVNEIDHKYHIWTGYRID